jgi:hypothetical protein
MKSKKEILKEAIILMEHKQARELIALKDEVHLTYESLRPINLLKHTLHEISSSPDVRKNLLNGAIGLASGYLARKVEGHSATPVKRILTTLAQFAVAKVTEKFSKKN